MSTFISIKDNAWQFRNTNFSKYDLLAVLSVAPKYIRKGIDEFEATRLLHCHGHISQGQYTNLLTRLQNCKAKWRPNLIFAEILAVMSFEELIQFIRRMKHYDFAAELLTKRNGDRVYIVDGADIGVSENILTYYSRTKCFMDDNIFTNRKIELETRFYDLKASLGNIIDLEEKLYAANKFAVVTFLRISQFRDKAKRESILNEMKESIPSDVDPTFSDIVYFGKMANTAVFAGETNKAKEYMNRAQMLANSCQQAFVKIFAHHDEQYIYRYLLSNHPCDEYVKRAVVSGQLGLDILLDLSEEKAMIWRKVFLSENAMSLLKIKNTFDILYSEDISDGDRQSAQELMCTLQRSTSGRERRREMVNSLCKARIHEVDDINLAQTYAEEARKFALEGSHFPADLENITRYKSFLNTNTHVKQKT
jgi:hypothetical protein